jgi:lysophospholipase L1-like esterase
VQIPRAEVRLAWGGLIALTAVTYPSPTYPGPLTLAGLLAAFLPGTLILSTAKGSSRVAGALERLLDQVTGRLSLLAGVLLAILLGLTFDAFVAFVLTGLCCSLLWLSDLAFRSAGWERRFSRWMAAGLSTFLTLVVVECVLNWGPVARRLGTPGELDQWARREGRRTNFFRFRSPYEDTRRKAGVRRVIALGDSFTEGSRIADSDSTWPALLEHILRQTPGGGPTEVINMGSGGFATGNEAELLDRIGWQFHPDLVIVQWLDNDAYVTLPNFGTAPSPFGPDAIVLIPKQYRSGWIRQSGILRLLERGLSSRLVNVLDLQRKQFGPTAPGWLAQQQAFREMGDSAARHCTPILLVLYPYLFPGRWTTETYPEREIHRRVAAAGRSAGLEVLDLLPAFLAAGKDLKEWWGTAYDSHPSGEAQLVAARAIAASVEEHRLLGDSTKRAGSCVP